MENPVIASDVALLQSEGLSSGTVARIALDLVVKFSGEGSSLLDVGCGRGDLLKGLRKQSRRNLSGCDGFKYVALENEGIQFDQVDLNGSLPYQNETFDVVSAIEVVEHLENPRHFVRELSRVLKPGGMLVMSTPNNESLTSLISLLVRGYFSAFVDRCYPAHITPVLRNDLMRMFQESNLRVERTLWSNEGRLPGLDLSWKKISFGILGGRLFSDNYFLVGKK